MSVRRIISAIAVMTVMGSHAADVAQSVVEQRHGLWRVAALPFENPAVNQWRMSSGLTNVSVDYSSRSDNKAVDQRLGDGDFSVNGGAETYTKYRNTTLWGYGRYLNGRSDNVVWNETADMDMLYPYLMADSVGGDIKREQYSFCGGYAATSGRLAWGACMSYLATLEYRDVDPRPKNVVGKLDLAIGIAYRIVGVYHAGLSANFRKYKQSNDIDFKSEMGVDKIFHLTGLGNHYNRFAGTGMSTYYDGYRYGLSADIYPSDGHGAFIACAVDRFTFDNILSDLNKLPLASAWHNEIKAEGGWLSPGEKIYWGASASFDAYRRHGSENIFGDASTSIYPQIASNELYADNYCSMSAKAMAGMHFGPVSRVAATLNGGWQRRTSAYIEPWSYTLTNAASAGLSVDADILAGGKWLFGLTAAFSTQMPFDCSSQFATSSDDETIALRQIEKQTYMLASHRQSQYSAGVNAAMKISAGYILGVNASWQHQSYCEAFKSDRLNLSLSLMF